MALLVRVILLASVIYLCTAQPVDEAVESKHRPHTIGVAYRDEQANAHPPAATTSNDDSSTKRRPHSVHISWRDQEANRTKRSVETAEVAPANDETHAKRRPGGHSVSVHWRNQEGNAPTPQATTSNDESNNKRRPHSVHISWRDQEANRTKRSVETAEVSPANDETHAKRRPGGHSVSVHWRNQEANAPQSTTSNDESNTKRRPHSVHISWRDQEANRTRRSAEAPSDGTITQRMPWWWSLIAPRDLQEANRTRRSAEGPSDDTITQRKPWWWSLIAPRDHQAIGTTLSSETPSEVAQRRSPPFIDDWRNLETNRTRRSVETPEAAPSNEETHAKRRPHSVHISWRDQQASANSPDASTTNDESNTKRRPHIYLPYYYNRAEEVNRTRRSAEGPSDESITQRRPWWWSLIAPRDHQETNRTRRSAEGPSDDTITQRKPWWWSFIAPRDLQEANRTRRSAEGPSDDTITQRKPWWWSLIAPRDLQEADPESKWRHVTISWQDADGHHLISSAHSAGHHGHHLTITWPEAPEDNPHHQHHHDHIHHGREVLFRANDSRPVVLQCRGDDRAREVLKYSWLKNSEVLNVTSNPDAFSSNADESRLTLKALDANAGDYQCLTQTSLGTASSRVISVKKTYLTKPDTVATNKYTPVEGAPFGLPCAIPDGYPKPEVQWVSQDVNNPGRQKRIRSKRILQSPDGTLWFSNVTQEDVSGAFKYVCQAKTPAYDRPVELAEASIDSVQASNGANYSDLVEQFVSPDQVALAGGVTEIYCIYGGTPLAHPDWYKDGSNVNGAPGGRVTRYNRSAGRRLVIHHTRATDGGNYTCVADNGAGAAKSHSMALTVEAKPRFTKRPQREVQAKQGLDLTIPCEASGVPTPDVTWTYNAQPLTTTDRITVGTQGVTIKGVQESDKGYYGCSIKNSHGNNFAESAVVVK